MDADAGARRRPRAAATSIAAASLIDIVPIDERPCKEGRGVEGEAGRTGKRAAKRRKAGFCHTPTARGNETPRRVQGGVGFVRRPLNHELAKKTNRQHEALE